MRINNKLLSIPPYISTSWKNIASLYLDVKDAQNILVIVLAQGTSIEIPHLEGAAIEAIFQAHAKFSEMEQSSKAPQRNPQPLNPSFPLDTPMGLGQFRIGFGNEGGLGSMLQHNPEQANSPNLPLEVLNKIAALSKAMGIDDPQAFPKGEPHCNCMHCQIARALHGEAPHLETLNLIEDEVTEEDLKFRLWDIAPAADNLYIVTNPLDPAEHYNVYLGDTIGCTCGEKNCEHIRAVLNS